jgi:(3,5-dihydroxyphenyl)acetyl-CoA 1,2-dioxygenase
MMTCPGYAERLSGWAATAPCTFGADVESDAAVLEAYAGEGERLLAELPAKPDRDAQHKGRAEEIHTWTRRVRGAFLARHTDAVYQALTGGMARGIRLPELVYLAADLFPGLVPTREQMDVEQGFVQASKEGREIDQGIFCGAVLRSPRSGRHLVEAMLRPTPRALDLLDGFLRTGRAELETVLVERRGPAAHVEFRNTARLNSEDNRLVADLDTAVDLALLDDRVRVGVLRGGAVDHPKYLGRRVFSAGVNLADLCDGTISFVEFLLGRELGYVNKMLRGLLTAPDARTGGECVQKPWISAVDTFAIGGGMQLLLVMDRVIAEEGAYFSLPAAEEGIVPGLGNLRLTRLTGARLARQVILGGRRIAATDPEAGLLCDEVVPAAGMDAAIDRSVAELAAPAVAANRQMLTLAEEPLDRFREYLAEFAVVQAGRTYSADVLAKVEGRRQDSRRRHRVEQD